MSELTKERLEKMDWSELENTPIVERYTPSRWEILKDRLLVALIELLARFSKPDEIEF